MTPRQRAEIAKAIVARLFTDGAGVEADQLVMYQDSRSMGCGWSQLGVTRQVEEILREKGLETRKRKDGSLA